MHVHLGKFIKCALLYCHFYSIIDNIIESTLEREILPFLNLNRHTHIHFDVVKLLYIPNTAKWRLKHALKLYHELLITILD